MSSLADEVEAGGGTDEAVALALGWKRDMGVWLGLPHFDGYIDPDGNSHDDCPAFLTDLNALAAEEKRRGFTYVMVEHCAIGRPGEYANAEVSKMATDDSNEIKGLGRCEGPNAEQRARLAALIRAVESEAAAIRGDAK